MAENASGEPEWMAAFLLSLERDDLAPATVRGYRYDLRHFLAWRRTVQDGIFAIQDLAEHDLIAYPQHMVAGGRRPAAINRLRTEKPTADQTRKLDRMEEQNRQLRAVTMEVLALAGKLRKGSIDRIMGMSDLELGLQALLAGRSSSRR